MHQLEELLVGMHVRVCDHQGKFLDRAQIMHLKERSDSIVVKEKKWMVTAEILLQSFQYAPGQNEEMLLIAELGWRSVAPDPHTGKPSIDIREELQFFIEPFIG